VPGGNFGNPGSLMANWFHEGSADFFSFGLNVKITDTKYLDARNTSIARYRPVGADDSFPLNRYVTAPGDPKGDWKYSYNLGRTAVEYIVASIGFEPILQVQREFKVTQDFNSAFERAIGMPINDFYAKFEIIRSKVGLPAGTSR
jgi:hypothetical protein